MVWDNNGGGTFLYDINNPDGGLINRCEFENQSLDVPSFPNKIPSDCQCRFQNSGGFMMFIENKSAGKVGQVSRTLHEFKKEGNEVKNFSHLDISGLPEASQAVLSKNEKYFAMIIEKGDHGNILLVWDIQNRK